ncbi:MAG TPA: hypothetical protein VMU42_03895 [Candidatus Sulfotelmatobacter sp.]|nr:hypothetical protein [Candidatus Sulfotelmatobacter sp.]
MSPASTLPAYTANMPLSELHTAELLVVAGARLWIAPHRQPGSGRPAWCGGFSLVGMDTADIAAFDRLLRIVATAAGHPLDLRCRHNIRLGADEAGLLRLVGLLQQDQRPAARAMLGHWLPATAARVAFSPALCFATALRDCGLPLPCRHGLPAGLAHPDRGLLLH